MGGIEDPTMYHAETQSGIIGLNVQLSTGKLPFFFSRTAGSQHTAGREKNNPGARKLLFFPVSETI